MEFQTADLLSQIVSINSVFPSEAERDAPGEGRLGEFLENLLNQLGFATHRQHISPSRFNVLGEKGTGDALLLYGHMDTVPAALGWSTDPWTPNINGDKLIGLGSHDMKGGLCAILQAINGFNPIGYKLKVAFLVDEENISEGGYTITQSAFVSDVIAALVPESGTAGAEANGPGVITLGRRGRITLRVQVTGKSAHAAAPELGTSAILRASQLAIALQHLRMASHPLLGKSNITIRHFMSQTAGLSIPDLAELEIDRHLVPPETAESAQSDLLDLIQKLSLADILPNLAELPITVTIPKRRTPYLMPYVVSEDDPFVQLVWSSAKEVVHHVKPNYGLSVADENYFGANLRLPVVVLGPNGGNDHAPNEWVSLSSLDSLIRIYQRVLHRFSAIL